jgi:hypothetical protein
MENKTLQDVKLALDAKEKNPKFWLRKTNKGWQPILIKYMDNKHIHIAIKLVKDNTKQSDDMFGEFTRKQWLISLKSELDRRDIITYQILSQFKGMSVDYLDLSTQNNQSLKKQKS